MPFPICLRHNNGLLLSRPASVIYSHQIYLQLWLNYLDKKEFAWSHTFPGLGGYLSFWFVSFFFVVGPGSSSGFHALLESGFWAAWLTDQRSWNGSSLLASFQYTLQSFNQLFCRSCTWFYCRQVGTSVVLGKASLVERGSGYKVSQELLRSKRCLRLGHFLFVCIWWVFEPTSQLGVNWPF